MDPQQQQLVDSIARTLQKCRSVLFITGAGISADSGLPTYRGIGGLYDVDVTEDGIPIEEALSGPMLRSNPGLTWKYLMQIARATQGASFNRGHAVIAEMEQRLDRVWTLTQNVDGLHRLAGATNVIEIHGNMDNLHCMSCGKATEAKPSAVEILPPRCTICDGVLRPSAVLFGEMLPDAALSQLQEQLRRGFDMVISVGTSSMFPYIQDPVVRARSTGIPTVEINPQATVISAVVDYHLGLGAAVGLDAIWQRCEGHLD